MAFDRILIPEWVKRHLFYFYSTRIRYKLLPCILPAWATKRDGSDTSSSDEELATAICSLTCTAWRALTEVIALVDQDSKIPYTSCGTALCMHLKVYACGHLGHTVEINWGATHHSPVPQGHQHSALSCDQGTFERRRKAGSYAVWWQIQASKVRNDCCFSLLVSGFGTLVNKSKRKIRRQLKWWDSHLCVSFTPALIGEACGLLTTKWSTLYNFAACLWLIHLMATCHILQIPLHKTVPCLPAGAQYCAVCMTYLKMPAENIIAVKAACK